MMSSATDDDITKDRNENEAPPKKAVVTTTGFITTPLKRETMNDDLTFECAHRTEQEIDAATKAIISTKSENLDKIRTGDPSITTILTVSGNCDGEMEYIEVIPAVDDMYYQQYVERNIEPEQETPSGPDESLQNSGSHNDSMGAAMLDNCTDMDDMKRQSKRMRDRLLKRQKRADPDYRQWEKNRAAQRMREKRKDATYREQEKLKDRIRRRTTREKQKKTAKKNPNRLQQFVSTYNITSSPWRKPVTNDNKTQDHGYHNNSCHQQRPFLLDSSIESGVVVETEDQSQFTGFTNSLANLLKNNNSTDSPIGQ